MKMTKRLILFDFDETYYKHHTHQADMPYLREMEGLLQNITTKNNVITANFNRKYYRKRTSKNE